MTDTVTRKGQTVIMGRAKMDSKSISSTAQTIIGHTGLIARVLFFKQVPLFADLTESELTMLVTDFVRRDFKQGETIFQQGDPGEVLYLIESGQVRIFVHGKDGQEWSVIVHGAGDIFGEMALIDNLPRSASAVAVEDTAVYFLSRTQFLDHMRRATQLSLNFMKALSVRLRYSTNQMGNLALLDIPSRLARKLLDLARTHGQPDSDGTRITFTQSELAAMIGATRESINKSLGTFKRQDLIRVEPGSITILNMEALQEIGS